MKEKTGIEFLISQKNNTLKKIQSIEKSIIKKQQEVETLKEDLKAYDEKISQAQILADKIIELSCGVDFENAEISQRLLTEYEAVVAKMRNEKNTVDEPQSKIAEQITNEETLIANEEEEKNDEENFEATLSREKTDETVFSSGSTV